jgi:hypothetical protein
MDMDINWSVVVWWASGLSLLGVVATAVGIPWVVSRLPHDYFSRDQRVAWRRRPSAPLTAWVLAIGKNALGGVLVLMGIVMLFTPGQGLLTILIGMLLINFPGKYRLERWLVSRPGVLRALNWLRERHGRRPFHPPEDHGSGG